MSGIRNTIIAVLVAVGVSPLAADSAAAGEKWLINIQRYLDTPEQCSAPHDTHAHARAPLDTSVYANPPHGPDTYARAPAYRNSRTARLPGREEYTPIPDEREVVSCLQGTRIVREHGFYEIEVAACNAGRYHVYEALRGRRPWRVKMSASSGEIIRAEPLY